ncbi:MAG: DoxX family protein [Actinomycetes bacterium]
MDTAMLVLRLVVGGLFVGHGLQKMFGWFGGPGLDGMAGALDSMGYRPAKRHALLAATTEVGGGALLVLGLFTPLAAAAIIGMMLNATLAVHRQNGLWVTNNGFEYPLVLGAAAFAIALCGAGAVSIDGAAGWNLSGWWGVLALLVGLAVGFGVFRTRAEPAETAAGEDSAGQTREERRAA